MLRTVLICFFLLAVANIAVNAYILNYEIPERQVRGDVPSVFFSPFRMVGKRSQFYGLFKQHGKPKGDDSFE